MDQYSKVLPAFKSRVTENISWSLPLVPFHCTLHASFPPVLDPAQIMFVVMFPLKELLLLHLEVETTGSLTVRRVRGVRPPLWLVEPHPDTRHILPASSPAFCLGSGARDTYLFSSMGALSWKNPHPETYIDQSWYKSTAYIISNTILTYRTLYNQ